MYKRLEEWLVADWLRKIVSSAVNVVAGGAHALGASQVSPAREERLELAPNGQLTIDTPSGSISITGCEGRHATLKYVKTCWGLSDEDARRAFDAVNVVVRLEGPATRITTERPRLSPASRVSVSYELAVPADVAVTAESASGTIRVCDMAAAVVASTASGSIAASGCSEGTSLRSASGAVAASKCAGRVELHAQSGSIDAVDCTGNLSLDSKSGAITVQGGKGEVDLRAVSGPISVDAVVIPSRFQATCVSGSVRATLSPEPGAELYARSVSGHVTLTLPENVCANIDCRTVSGGVNITLPCTVTTSNPRHIVASCGGHGGRPVRVKAEATSGSVQVGAQA